jgi:APA family basic amino acid/polyamine antiporter
MVVGLAIYGLYGRWHSRLANEDSWDFDIGDTDPGTGGLQAIRNDPDRTGELKAVRTPQQNPNQTKPTRGKHMRN